MALDLNLTPGTRFLLRTLLSPLLVYALLHHLQTRTQFKFLSELAQKLKININKKIDLKCFLTLYYPTSFLLRVLSKWVREEVELRRMGAVRVPTANGKWIGNVDVMLALAASQEKNMYLGQVFKPFVDSHGSLYSLRMLWMDRYITIEPDHIKQMLATEFENFEKGEEQNLRMQSVLGTGVFNSDGDMWRFHRAMTRPFFSRDRISHFEVFAKHADDAISRIKRRTKEFGYENGTEMPIDIQDVFARFTLDSASDFLFGKCVHSLRAGLPYPHNFDTRSRPQSEERLKEIAEEKKHSAANAFAESFVRMQLELWKRSAYRSLWPLREIKEDVTRDDYKVVRAFLDPIIEETVRKVKEKKVEGKARGSLGEAEKAGKEDIEEDETLLEHLVKITDDQKVLKDEILNITVAGRDTTACTLTFATYLLAMHPSIFKRLRTEVLDVVGPDSSPTFDHIRNMKYMRAVINETLRLFPPVPGNIRSSINATTFKNPDPNGKPFYIPARTPIGYSPLLMHRRKDLWGPDAEEFDPDRFLDERVQKYLVPNPFIFLPFNAGPRICLGQQFAYNETSFMLVKLLQVFDGITLAPSAQPPQSRPPTEWRLLEGRPRIEQVVPRTHLTMYAHHGLWVRMHEAGEADDLGTLTSNKEV